MALNINWDRGLWLYVPTEFPWQQFADAESWITALVDAYREADLTEDEAEWLGDYVRGLRANNTAGAHRFAWFGDPTKVLLSVDVFEQAHDPSLSLDDLVGSEGTENDVRPPVITDVVAEELREGYRVERAIRMPLTTQESLGDPGEEVIQFMVWVFRGGGSDVIVSATHREPYVLASMLEELETFIDTISLV